MILDHINGINNDDRLENLRLVCPNCNSQLPTHCGRTRKRQIFYCINQCNRIVSDKNRKCQVCAHLALRKSERPSKEILLDEIKKTSFVDLGKRYGVSDNTIRNWCKAYEIEI